MVAAAKVPPVAARLGYAGLIPFVICSAMLWFVDQPLLEYMSDALLLYAAIILSFMGAIHWGLGIANADAPSARLLVISVIPPLIAWFAAFLPTPVQLSVLYLTFAALCVFDSREARAGRAPSWYPRLRVPLTVVVVVSLINAQLALSLA